MNFKFYNNNILIITIIFTICLVTTIIKRKINAINTLLLLLLGLGPLFLFINQKNLLDFRKGSDIYLLSSLIFFLFLTAFIIFLIYNFNNSSIFYKILFYLINNFIFFFFLYCFFFFFFFFLILFLFFTVFIIFFIYNFKNSSIFYKILFYLISSFILSAPFLIITPYGGRAAMGSFIFIILLLLNLMKYLLKDNSFNHHMIMKFGIIIVLTISILYPLYENKKVELERNSIVSQIKI